MKFEAVVFKTPSGYEVRSVETSGVGYGETTEEALADLEAAINSCLKLAKSQGLPLRTERNVELAEIIQRAKSGQAIPRNAVGMATVEVSSEGKKPMKRTTRNVFVE